MLGIWEDRVPQFVTLPLAQAKQFWKQRFHAANEKAQQALMRGLVFFFSEGEDFMFFFYGSHHVPWGSQKLPQVPRLFLKTFPIAPQFYPIWFCPKFYSHAYKLERWAIGEHICFYVATWVA